MTPEEYERLKDEEKAHLRKLRDLKHAVRELERKKKLQSTLQDMSHRSSAMLDEQEKAVERLAQETALQQARLDVALDASTSADDDPAPELDEEMRARRARLLVEEIRATLDVPVPPDGANRSPTPTSRGPSESMPASEGRGASANPTEDRADRPEKTIGRM